MAITIDLTDANTDGKGINFQAYLANFDKKYVADSRGGFTNEYEEGAPIPDGGYVAGGDDYVTWDGLKNGQSVIFEGGDKGWTYNFDGPDGKYGTGDEHLLSGDITAITFGTGTKDTPDYTNNGEIRISFAEFDVPNYSNSFLSQISEGNIKGLMKFLNSDSIEFNGSSGKDAFTGFNKADTLHGEGGNDKLNGGKGNDLIYGDEGNDVLAGGKGSDTFVFEAGDGKDKITDFGAGADVIDFAGQFADFDAVLAVADDGKKGVTITYEGGSVLLVGWERADLTASHFDFIA